MSVVLTKVIAATPVADNVVRLDLAVPADCTWKTGQFARLALPGAADDQWRCYSIGSAAGSDRLTFFIARVKGGAVSPKLCALKAGDEVQIDTEMSGMLIEDRLEAGGKDLWLLATGTGVSPFIAVSYDPAIMDKYERVILVHGVRTFNETAYVAQNIKLQPKLSAVACVTREKGALISARIPDAIASGELERVTGLEITPEKSRVMICGNPAMVKGVREAMKARGIVSPRGGKPGQLLAENFWL